MSRINRLILAIAVIGTYVLAQPNVAAWDVIKVGLQENNPDKKKQAVLALATIGPAPEVIELLNQALRDKEIIIRQTAAAAIGEARITQCIPFLKAALDDTSEVAFTAAKALWDMGDHSGAEVFQEAYTGQLQGPGFVESTLRDAKAKMRNPAALAKMGMKEASGALLGPFSMGIVAAQDMMKDTGAPTRALAITLLSQACDARGNQLMEWVLTYDKSHMVRAATAKALGRCGSLNHVTKLMQLIAESNEAVRYMAAAAIVRLSIEKGAPK